MHKILFYNKCIICLYIVLETDYTEMHGQQNIRIWNPCVYADRWRYWNIKKNHPKHWAQSPIDALVIVAHVQIMPSFLGIQRFENYMGSTCGLYAGCVSTSDGMAFSWYWILDHILKGIVMQQDNAVSDSTHRVKDQLNSMWWEVL